MVAAGQEKEIVFPGIEDVNHGHVFKRPLIESLNGFRRWNRPFFDITNAFFLRINGPQSPGAKAMKQVENLRKNSEIDVIPTAVHA